MTRFAGTNLECLKVSAAVFAAFTGTQALATPAQDFDSWFTRLVARADQGPSVDGLKITYEESYLFVPAPGELEALRASVQGHPDHPRKSELEAFERRLRGDKSETRKNVLWRLGDQWRWNSQTAEDGADFTDRAWGNGVVWMMSSHTLTICAAESVPKTQFRLDRVPSTFTYDCVVVLNGGLGAAAARGIELKPRAEGSTWALTDSKQMDDGTTFAMSAKGTWNADAGWGTVDETTWSTTTGDGARRGLITKTSDWHFEPSISLGIAGRADISKLDGRSDKRIVIESVVPFDRAEFVRVVTLPRSDGVDAARGPTTFTSINDLRDAAPSLATTLPSSGASSRSATSILESTSLRPLGWMLAAMLATSIVLLRVRASQRGNRSSAQTTHAEEQKQ